ncbi:MAG: peptide chain release factor N(5)-glutamine methyltransferase [Alphaproteobacteria bacterium]|nr:peptide chain release factor N(5)-glutamine methyltransferase [Alphaproteobacteria bacterium]
MMNNLQELITFLKEAGLSAPRLEATLLVEFVGKGKSIEDFSTSETQNLKELLEKRCVKHMPLCKIVGQKGFYKYDFIVSENVLSPRADTEILVEKAIDYLNSKKLSKPKILELGLGSGCILFSILADVKCAVGVGLDISEKALAIASQNLNLLGLKKRAKLLQGSWFDEKCLEEEFETFDVIVSNPPYIPSADVLELDTEVKDYDPLIALDGGEDGLRDYRKIAEVSKKLLKPDGYIFLEIGINQAQDVIKIFENQLFKLVEVVKDLARIERCIILKK